jgi:hypothetical protein
MAKSKRTHTCRFRLGIVHGDAIVECRRCGRERQGRSWWPHGNEPLFLFLRRLLGSG